MKILILADRLTLGGLETHIVTFSNELLDRGHQIILFTAYTDPNIIAQIKNYGGNFHHLNWTTNPLEDIKGLAPDIIHAHPFTAIIHGYNIAQALKKPFFITMHGLYNFGLDQSALGRKISQKVQRIIAVDYAVATLLKNSGPSPEKIVVIPNGIDLSIFYPLNFNPAARSKYNLASAWFTITVISRFDDGKERPILQLLRVAPFLAEYLNGLNIIIVGDGSWYNQLKTTADLVSQGNEKLKVLLVGRQDDVREFLSMANCVFACDRAALEAIACGRRVFAMNGVGFGGPITEDNFQEFLLYRQGYQELTDQQLINRLREFVPELEQQLEPVAESEIIGQYFNIHDLVSELEQVYQQ